MSKKRQKLFPFEPLHTNIPSLDELLRTASDKGSIQYQPERGFLGVIFGAAGSGKSVLGLQLCCSFVIGDDPHPFEDADMAAEEKKRRKGKKKMMPSVRHAVLITQESSSAVREKVTKHFGFFLRGMAKGIKVDLVAEEDLPEAWTPSDKGVEARQPTFTIVQMPLDAAQQREKLVYIFRLLNETFCRSTPPDGPKKFDPKRRLLVVVDNAETISQAAYREVFQSSLSRDDGSSEKPAHFYKHLREYCARHRLNTWFAFEETQVQQGSFEEAQIATTEQAYAADIVIRLGVTVFPAGYRERSLEIVKAKNQAYRRGRHHYSIRGISGKDDENEASQSAAREGKTGIVVYPSLPTQLHLLANRDRFGEGLTPLSAEPHQQPEIFHFLGLAGVDEAVQRENTLATGYLREGTVSVLVSDLDALASEIALHFALHEIKGSPVETLYITTLHRAAELRRMAERYEKLKLKRHNVSIRELKPEHISEGKLLKDIEEWIGNKRRVVFDNIFELASKFPLVRDNRHFITALFEVLRQKGAASFVVDTVEVGEGRNPLDQSYAAGVADHVFVLRHVEFQSQTRKVFSVLKLPGFRAPTQLWELREHPDSIHAEDRLIFFKGVLAGKPEPVEVTLSLFADAPGSPLAAYLDTQQLVLQQTFGQNIKIRQCHADSYVSLQHTVATSHVLALGDCHVISIDEVWVEELIRSNRLIDIPREYLEESPKTNVEELDHANYVTTAQNLALQRYRQHPRTYPNLVIPDRNNVGVLAYNRDVWRQASQPGPNVPCWAAMLDEWANFVYADLRSDPAKKRPVPPREPEWLPQRVPFDFEGRISWKHVVLLQSGYVRQIKKSEWQGWGKPLNPALYRDWEPKLLKQRRDDEPLHSPPAGAATGLPDWGVFTFTMDQREAVACFFLELLMSVLKNVKADFPVKVAPNATDGELLWNVNPCEETLIGLPTTETNTTAWGAALALMLHLLSPWDILRLSHGWYRPVREERPCLFSRQWFNSWGILGLEQAGLRFIALPNGAAGYPTPVSGAWYLGILRGSAAQGAGARLIRHLTSPDEELHKHNRGIGMPVRVSLYAASGQEDGALEMRSKLPYRQQFVDIGNLQKELAIAEGEHEEAKKLVESILAGQRRAAEEERQSGVAPRKAAERKTRMAERKRKLAEQKCNDRLVRSCQPFYRSRIRYYSRVSPLLMGMMVDAAREALKPEYLKWLWERPDDGDDGNWKDLRAGLEGIVESARKRYAQILDEERRRETVA